MRRRLLQALTALLTLAAVVVLPELPAAASFGYTNIIGLQSGKCINVPNNNSANGVQLIIYTCANPSTSNETWFFDDDIRSPNTPGYYNIQNQQTGKCLTQKGASTAVNQPIIQYDCNRGTNEQWYTQKVYSGPPDWYYIRNEHGGLCLAVKGGLTGNGQPLLQFTCNGGDNELWTW
jgi:hypothetical protein